MNHTVWLLVQYCRGLPSLILGIYSPLAHSYTARRSPIQRTSNNKCYCNTCTTNLHHWSYFYYLAIIFKNNINLKEVVTKVCFVFMSLPIYKINVLTGVPSAIDMWQDRYSIFHCGFHALQWLSVMCYYFKEWRPVCLPHKELCSGSWLGSVYLSLWCSKQVFEESPGAIPISEMRKPRIKRVRKHGFSSKWWGLSQEPFSTVSTHLPNYAHPDTACSL